MPSAPKKSTKSAPVEPTLVKADTTKDVAPAKSAPKVVKEKKEPVKKAVSKSTTATKDDTPAETTLPIEEANVVISTDATTSITENFSEFLNNFQKMVGDFSRLKTELRTLEKKTLKELRVVNKLNAKRKKKSTTRAPSGFVKPTLISNELATFLGKPFGSEMARTDVTREINAYIRAHELQDKSNGRKINPDPQLASLLKITSTDELTYFNLQRYMSPHFAKNVAGVPSVVPTPSAAVASPEVTV